ncbi:fras1 related extracellular matrix protein [Schistosoma japonicum]|nr:fras1 related extracellular matrix protein [Schistosoma japonicum]
MNHYHFLVVCIILFTERQYLIIAQNNAYDSSSPFRWFKHDNFDIISRKMDQANPENCETMSEADLRLPPTSLSQLPQYNEIPLRQWFTNRSKLLHLHNLALNRAFFYSYILQRLDHPTRDPQYLPSLMYYYLSSSADISSGPNVINISGVFMDTNTTYANWYELKDINKTLPLFAPLARRLDNWNDEMNFLRIPTNNTIEITDLGAGPNNNYTASWYKNNPYIRDREMGIDFIPDRRGTAPSKNQYTTKIQLATINGDPIEELENTKFYGPNAPGVKETFLPVRFTRPYYDCGGTNRWIVSSVAALTDFMPRYSNITRLRGPRMIGVVVQSMDFYRIDFNPCPPGLGNPNHYLAGIARCKPTTLCVCQPGHRLPYEQNGPFRGVDIEAATEEEYRNNFDCIPVGWREVIPEETGMKNNLERVRRSLNEQSNTLWNRFKAPSLHLLNTLLTTFDLFKQNIFPTPSKLDESMLIDGILEKPLKVTNLDNQPLDRLVPGYRSVSHLLPLEQNDFNLTYTNNDYDDGYYDNNDSLIIINKVNNANSKYQLNDKKKRERRNVDTPFYTVGVGTVFDADRYFEVQRLIAHVRKVTSQNCHLMTPDQLILPGEVSYGVEKQFEMVGRTALRLSHFLSAYYQNNVVGELYGSLKTGFPINRFQLFGEVFANVLSNFDIVSSGIFFDYQMFTDHDGTTWDLFAPYAYKPQLATQAVEAIDMSINTYRDYTEKSWFRTLKSRWASSRQSLERITAKPFIRSDVNGSQLQRYFTFPIYYRVPHYEEGYWTQPYFDCDGMVKDWVITYATPFFGVIGEEKALRFMGVVTTSVKLTSLDINQCPQSFYTPNFFKNTARCDFRSTYCKLIPRHYFLSGSYKCECRQGFEYPLNDRTWYFHGEMMEREYQLMLAGKPNRYELLRCRQGIANELTYSILLVFALINLPMIVIYSV